MILRNIFLTASLFSFVFGIACPNYGLASNYKLETLSNGVSYVLMPNDKTPNVNQIVLFKTGYINDPKDQFGVTGLLSYLLTYHHKNYKTDEINKLMQTNAIEYSVNPSYDEMYFSTVSSSGELENSIKWMSERINKVNISEETIKNSIDALKNVEKKSVSDTTKFSRAIQEKLFSKHPYGEIFLPDKLNANKSLVEATNEYYKNYITPGNMVIVLVGDFSSENAKELLNRYYGSVQSESSIGGTRSISARPVVISDTVKMKSSSRQLPLYSAWYLVPEAQNEQNKTALSALVIKQLLTSSGKTSIGSNMIDRGYLATKYNVTYSPVSLHETSFKVDVELRRNVSLDKAQNALNEVLKQLKENTISEEELSAAKKVLVTKAKLANDENLTSGLTVAENVSVKNNPNYFDELLSKLDLITVEDIQTTASMLFDDKNKVSGYLEP